jgi:phenylalanyl-tRNA synthetase beta chain
MKVSYNWLKQYLNTTLTPDEMSEILTDTGLEVEGCEKIEAVKGGLEGVFVGEVLTCVKHGDADKLNVTTVNVGLSEPIQIVCGAPNVAAGQKVIVATVGCTLYPNPEEPFKIKAAKIRGVESFGMICAEDELGLGQSHDGILILPENTEAGMPAAKYFDLEDDFGIEIGLTPNRADAMGHIGVARDIAAYLSVHKSKHNIIWPSIEGFIVTGNQKVNIKVEDPIACPKYTGTTITGVKVQSSPAWLQKRLRAAGFSPINNVVDVTNFVMMELGTPLHAFDLQKVGNEIVVKRATEGQKVTTLDGVERTLSSEDQVITNGKENLCMAGVFGGIDSGISAESTSVFLESAYFEPVVTRKMARRHGLNTDASFRFERGVDPELTLFALKRAATLIQEVAGGEIAMEPLEVSGEKIEHELLNFSYQRCVDLIGANISNETIDSILEALDIKIMAKKGDDLTLKVPAYRIDVTREADVIEEILRIYGFNRIPIPEKLNASIPKFEKPDVEHWKNSISEMFVGMGFSEMLNNSLTSSKYVEKLGGEVLSAERNVEILNPLSQELNVMRQSMLFSALEVVEYNQNRQSPDLKLYEFGKTYHKYESYAENQRVLLLITGRKEQDSWNASKDKQNFYGIKGVVEALVKRLGLTNLLQYKPLKNSLMHDGAQVYILKQKIGEIGWVNKDLKKSFGLREDVFVADLDWDALFASLKMAKTFYKELPKTFATRRDFSLLVDAKVNFADIEEVAKNCDKKILRSIGLFDVYEGKNLDEGKKSYAVSFTFQDDNHTLKDQQVDQVMDKIRVALEEKLNAVLRK